MKKFPTVYVSSRECNSWNKERRNKPVAKASGERYREREKGKAHPFGQYKTSTKRSNRP